MVNNKFIVEGFEFSSEQEANDAKSELKGVNYIVSRTDMRNPQSVLAVYNSIIDKKLLKTPIGIKFLKEIQDVLLTNSEIDDNLIKPIPAVMNISYIKTDKVGLEKEKKNKSKYRKNMRISIVINIILIIFIVLTFFIIKNSKNTNIINYEDRILEKYSAWEEDLNQRESILDEKELIINSQN